MSYTKQNFTTGQVLKASHLNTMENAIASNADAIASNADAIAANASDIETLNNNSVTLPTAGATVGGSTKPVYVNSGTVTAGSAYVPASGGTFTGTVKFDSQPQSKYGDNYYTIPFNRGNNLISFLWTTSGLNIYIDTTLIGTLPNGFSNTNFKVNGINFGNDIYIYNNGSGQLYCRTGTNGNYQYKQLAP